MKKLEKASKLNFKRFQISRVQNLRTITGGNAHQNNDSTVTDTQRMPG